MRYVVCIALIGGMIQGPSTPTLRATVEEMKGGVRSAHLRIVATHLRALAASKEAKIIDQQLREGAIPYEKVKGKMSEKDFAILKVRGISAVLNLSADLLERRAGFFDKPTTTNHPIAFTPTPAPQDYDCDGWDYWSWGCLAKRAGGWWGYDPCPDLRAATLGLEVTMALACIAAETVILCAEATIAWLAARMAQSAAGC